MGHKEALKLLIGKRKTRVKLLGWECGVHYGSLLYVTAPKEKLVKSKSKLLNDRR